MHRNIKPPHSAIPIEEVSERIYCPDKKYQDTGIEKEFFVHALLSHPKQKSARGGFLLTAIWKLVP